MGALPIPTPFACGAADLSSAPLPHRERSDSLPSGRKRPLKAHTHRDGRKSLLRAVAVGESAILGERGPACKRRAPIPEKIFRVRPRRRGRRKRLSDARACAASAGRSDPELHGRARPCGRTRRGIGRPSRGGALRPFHCRGPSGLRRVPWRGPLPCGS